MRIYYIRVNQEDYRKLISGQNSSLSASLLRSFLGAAAGGYSAIIRLRNFLYSKKWLKTHLANAIVFSVGNITAGGTGKTPLVIWLCNKITQNYGCAILTRGYKAQNYGDEPAILADSCPDAKVIVNPDRVAAAAEAVNRFGAKVLIMDDGFQHRRLGRDLDIITIDSTSPFGYDKMLPAGLLREPIAALKRAGAAVITRCDQTEEAELSQIEKKLQSINPDMIIARAIHAPVCAKSIDSRQIRLEELRGKKVFAFCGIGNPEAFLNTIKRLGAELVGSKTYNDHHNYTANDIAQISQQAERLKTDLILTTEKDRTKIILNSQQMPLAYLAVELKFIAGEDKITRLIEDTLAGKIPGN